MKAEQEKTGLTGRDKQQSDLQNAPDRDVPEGLQRPRKGPYDKNAGRDEAATQVPRAQDDHDPNDLGQQQANKKRGVEPEKKEKTDDMGFPPGDESKFG